MKLIKPRPLTPGQRHQVNLAKFMLAKDNKLGKTTITMHHKCKGRSPQTGHITAWHRGGGHKQKYREIKFDNKPSESIVLTTMYDPYRTAFINFNFDLNNKKFFRTISTDSIYPGTLLTCAEKPEELKLGTRTMLKSMPTGTIIHSLSLSKLNYVSSILYYLICCLSIIGEFRRAQYIRSAGTSGQIMSCNEKTAKVRLPSERIIEVSSRCYATIGEVSNRLQRMTVLGKAGRSRHLGRRPHVRGIAMNPVDHPHGGRSNGGRPSCSPWGKPTKCGFSMVKKSRKARRLKKQIKIDKLNAKRRSAANAAREEKEATAAAAARSAKQAATASESNDSNV